MKRRIILAIILALTLTGCADTTVYLPEGVESAVIVPARETVAPTQTPTETATEERIYTEKIQFGGNTSNDKTPSAPTAVVGSTTVTRPAEETAPPKETKPKDHSVTVTVPVSTESKETEPESTNAITATRPVIVATEPKATEGKENSITVTMPVATESKETEPESTNAITVTRPVIVATEPQATEGNGGSITVTMPAATESTETEPESTNATTVTRPVIDVTEPQATEGNGGATTVTMPVATETTEPIPEHTHATTVTRPVEFPTEAPTQSPTVTPTKPTEAPTEPPTEKPTEPPAEKPTEPPTEKPTEPPETPVEPPTEMPTQPPSYDISDYQPGALEYAIAQALNAYRGEKGLPALAYDPDLCAIASYRSFEVSRVWSHTRPDGRSFSTVLSDFDYRVSAAAELLGYATGDVAAIAAKWIGSEDHQEILLGSYDTIGIGIYKANGVTYVTCLLVE